jgi:hypothetical protein
MKNWRYYLTTLVLAALLPTLAGHAEEPSKVSTLMRKKLEHSQKVLEALALNDYDRIASNANELILISKAAEWKVHKTPQYEVYSNEFRRNAEAMAEAAKAKNIDSATLAYVDMTLTCVKCHKHVREIRMGRLDNVPDLQRILVRNGNEGK